MRTSILRTNSGSEYQITEKEGKSYFGCILSASEHADRFMDQLYEIEVHECRVGSPLVVHGVTKDFPTSNGWLQTSRVVEIRTV